MSSADLLDVLPSKSGSGSDPARFRLSVSGAAWVFFLGIVVLVVPRFERVFGDFGISLPWATVLLVRASHWVNAHSPQLLVILLGITWVMPDAFRGRGRAGGSRAGSVLMLAAPLILIVLTVLALGLPLNGLLNRLSG